MLSVRVCKLFGVAAARAHKLTKLVCDDDDVPRSKFMYHLLHYYYKNRLWLPCVRNALSDSCAYKMCALKVSNNIYIVFISFEWIAILLMSDTHDLMKTNRTDSQM